MCSLLNVLHTAVLRLIKFYVIICLHLFRGVLTAKTSGQLWAWIRPLQPTNVESILRT